MKRERPFDAAINAREAIGLGLIIVGVVLTPVAWAWSARWWLLAFSLIVVGAFLFYTDRMIRREEDRKRGGGGSGALGPAMPTDVHSYTGWRDAGRTSTMRDDHHHGSGTDGGGDGAD